MNAKRAETSPRLGWNCILQLTLPVVWTEAETGFSEVDIVR